MTGAEKEDRGRWIFPRLALGGWIWPLLLLSFFLVYCHNVSSSYQAVSDSTKLPWSGKDKINTPREFVIFPPDHLVRDGKLYLRVQTVRQLILLNGVHMDRWNEKRIVAFRATHPELEEHWPDAERPDGGVTWIRPGP